MAQKSMAQKGSVVAQGIGFFQDSILELKKVISPTRQETVQATIMVLIMIVLFAVFLGFADMLVGILGRAVGWLPSLK